MPRNQKSLNEILEDLFMIDPSLKKHKKDVSRIVQAMLQAQPDTQFDETFARRLKSRLLAETETQPEQTRFNFAQAMQKWIYGFGGAAVALAVVMAIMTSEVSTPLLSSLSDQSAAFKPQTVVLPGKAFGSLATLSAADSATTSFREGAASPTFGMGGGGNPAPTAMGGDPAIDSKMIAPNPITYKFVYKGETLVLDQTQGDVFKRLKGDLTADSMLANLRGMDLDLADITSFSNLKLMMFQVVEDKPNGLAISVDMNEESLSIYQNWMKWQYDYNQQPGGAVPSDAELIRIANEFVAAHGIDTTAYGQPVVDHRWRQYILRDTPASEIYAPMELTVRYPLLLNGSTVREQYGDEYGFFVSVNLQHMVVSGVTNLTTQRYEKSSYELETNVDRVLKVAQQGGNQWYWQAEDAKEVEVGLGTPSLVYMRYWIANGNTSSEVYVPALYFPVTEKPADAQYLQDGITVPLAKEVLDQYGQNPDIMPLEKPMIIDAQPTPAVMPRG
jgi:hypothetical protein